MYLIELHPLLRGPGLWVGGSEDPELSLDQSAVSQVDSADVKVDDSVVGAGCCWLHRILREQNKALWMTNAPTTSRAFTQCCIYTMG